MTQDGHIHTHMHTGGTTARLLQRACILPHPTAANVPCVAAGDEATNSVLVWSSGGGSQIADLPMSTGTPCIDVKGFRASSRSPQGIAALTEGRVELFVYT